MKISKRNCARSGKLLPTLLVCSSFGCLPDDALRQVLGENILLTTATVIQTLTSLIFNGLFGLI